ncbi:hypothetical protein [Spirosoma utsteinense]|uniref:Lipocalin-like domain-containing protein n=1 Tax=Spirosoma utsteinense TaxID=2585773 RepID=A0ABR6WB01_9BACT|nr:hypothetical protein [Spirosoma utsteinense]MBC3785691.1 hypothetical protein [Spirosoma utsteinense]MBC3793731.1 hypothetical protein [Spirosoma utsteinense]
MISLRFLLVSLLLSATLFSCKDDDKNNPTVNSQTELLVSNNWQTTRVSTTDGQTIATNRLGTSTQVLFGLDMQFRNNNTVRAVDRVSKQIINGGTWTLAPDGKSMDVDVTGFKGNFPIVELNRTKLILRQRAPVDGKDTDINLEFDPSV